MQEEAIMKLIVDQGYRVLQESGFEKVIAVET